MNSIYELIRSKREGGEHSAAEIDFLIRGLMSGETPDYQISAWLMAVCFRGLSLGETVELTRAMCTSGERLDLSDIGHPVMDKHSTGGVGDKVTLVLAPAVAACGVVFGKMSGRALGHTGGTVDKLEAVPGFRSELSADEFQRQLREIGICVSGQSATLAPADKKLYALRDLTATVESNPLIAASIMSKKIAAGSTAVVMDVKVGRGAFFPTRGHASGVATLMRGIGEVLGVRVECLMTSMEQPLGMAIGNALEVREAMAALKGEGPADLREVVVALGGRLLAMSDLGIAEQEGRRKMAEALDDGSALAKFRAWMEAQGAYASFIDDPERLDVAGYQAQVPAAGDGFVGSLDARAVGEAAMALGAGRSRLTDRIDHGAGIMLHKKIGDGVGKGEPLATLYARTAEAAGAVAAQVLSAYAVSTDKTPPPSVILG
jgi:pyrimidine-nucleoside phosphorylase